MIIRKSLTFIVFLFSFVSFSNAEELKINADTNNVSIGDPVNIKLELKTENIKNYDWPTLDLMDTGLDIINEYDSDTLKEDNILTISKSYVVTAFDSGSYTIPGMSIYTIGEDSDTLSKITSDSLNLRFDRVKVDTTEAFKDIKSIIDVPVYENLFFWIIIGIAVIISIILLVYYYKKRDTSEKKSIEEDYDPSIPPYVLAIESLKSLREDKLWQKGEVKDYYTRLTDILRLYIKRVYDIKALEMTSDQLIASLKKETDLSAQLIENISLILSGADMSKFAKAAPLPDENTKAMDLAIDFVETTKPDSEENKEGDNV